MNEQRLASWPRISALLAAFLTASLLSAGISPAGGIAISTKEYDGTALMVRLYLKPLPERMPGSLDDSPEMIALGRKLFFERDISLNKSQACSDCHPLDGRGSGVDNLPTSKGAIGSSGKRNAPTVLNAGFQVVQFWDGRADDLVKQAKGPLLNPMEMAMRTEEDVVNRLKEREEYPRGFARAFPQQEEPVTFPNIARAIAAFERTLVAPSRFDRFLKGESGALAEKEKKGLQRFVDIGCVECHNSYPVGGRSLRKVGIHHPYENQADSGRHGITGQEEDKFVFKVPMLRNVTRTAPYFHDGKVAALPEAVRLMAWMQLDKVLSPREIDEIVTFLAALAAEQPINGSPP